MIGVINFPKWKLINEINVQLVLTSFLLLLLPPVNFAICFPLLHFRRVAFEELHEMIFLSTNFPKFRILSDLSSMILHQTKLLSRYQILSWDLTKFQRILKVSKTARSCKDSKIQRSHYLRCNGCFCCIHWLTDIFVGWSPRDNKR